MTAAEKDTTRRLLKLGHCTVNIFTCQYVQQTVEAACEITEDKADKSLVFYSQRSVCFGDIVRPSLCGEQRLGQAGAVMNVQS